jgi:hypothetical protein
MYRGKWNIFGELSQANGRGYGVVQGIIANIISNVETALHIRYYSPKYFSNYGRSFAEYGGIQNERGIYWGIKVTPVSNLEIRGYFDSFRSDWSRYNTAAPVTGNEVFANIKYEPRPSMHLAFIFKHELKFRNNSKNVLPAQNVREGIKKNYQLIFEWHPIGKFLYKTRIQGSTYRFLNSQTTGYCIAQDITYKTSKLKLDARIAYFTTEDYFNRQYMYERDLLYAFSFPAYNGHGFRSFLLLRYNPIRNLDFWCRIAHYHYLNVDAIGTGLMSISGNKKTEIKCQVRLKF